MDSVMLGGKTRLESSVTKMVVPVQTVSPSIIQCDIPSIPSIPNENMQGPKLWRIKLVSHEGVELSTPSETIVFDSVCWDCSGFSKTCVKK
ncbi:uncharacterized protein LOC106153360 [Lingula anatina]|uniref:Uncharacterized protein LOC106153360 n=1 Tax=Lingula anatina TaxID=7574 RepID=A0A2R2MU55_LINAN|nr:uncharacterized protein LOC106153360 [Lingula anatina]|eukprot:XP_023933657.1 uncharacterized protein LOC106153360 [Lingula anatina]